MKEYIKKELEERKARIGTDWELPTDKFRVSIIESGLIGLEFDDVNHAKSEGGGK